MRLTTRPVLGLTAVLSLAIFVGVGCSAGSGRADVIDVLVSPNDLQLFATVDTCGADLSGTVDEDDEAVTIEVSFANDDLSSDCADGLTLDLQDPLGDRIVIDQYDFQPVEIRRGR